MSSIELLPTEVSRVIGNPHQVPSEIIPAEKELQRMGMNKIHLVIPDKPTRNRYGDFWEERTCGGDCPGPTRLTRIFDDDPNDERYSEQGRSLLHELGNPPNLMVVFTRRTDFSFSLSWYKTSPENPAKNVFVCPEAYLTVEDRQRIERAGTLVIKIPELALGDQTQIRLVADQLRQLLGTF